MLEVLCLWLLLKERMRSVKSKIKMLGLLAFAFMIVPFAKVDAIYVDDIGGNVTSIEESNVWYLTVQDDDRKDLIIRNGETVVLDLNGHTFTNYTAANSVIWVQDGGNLTIIDSVGTGVINKSDASSTPTVNNQGTLTVKGGTITASGAKSASLYNSGTLTFTDGTITTEEDNVFGLVNEGTAVISGGKFVQAHNFSVLNNANKMEISGGDFAVSEGNTNAYSLITNQGSSAAASLEVTGGTFKANNNVFYNEGEDKVVVSGGTYSHDVSKYLADGFNLKQENGEYVLVKDEQIPVTDDTDKVTAEEIKNPETSDNVIVYVLLALVGLGAAAITTRKLVKKSAI